ncbi:MAG: TIM-barrel domain-containing protein [Mucilaginibacter sp.]
MKRYFKFVCIFLIIITRYSSNAQQIVIDNIPAQLDIRPAGQGSIRITLKPLNYKGNFASTPAVLDKDYGKPIISLTNISKTVKKSVGDLNVEVTPTPVMVTISNKKGQLLQRIRINDNGSVSFQLDKGPVLGLGEGGQAPEKGIDWRTLPVQYDRKGRYYKMQPRWQSDAYGSRNPVPLLIDPGNWAIFVVSPWAEVDLTAKDQGLFIPWKPGGEQNSPQTMANQALNLGKGLPPIDQMVPGLFDLFVLDAHDPAVLMKNFSMITGPAAMPPKWALGYMQSHRTLETEKEMIGIVDTFRTKKIPLDAVIYLGTGFVPRGWNKKQPSFEFNPEVFKRDPKYFMSDMHALQVKVVLHMVPWDRDKLPGLHGNIPAKAGEKLDASHIQSYWNQHIPLVNTGVDAFWPDEGDWFNLDERIKRHQLYYQGQLSAKPNLRPWSLQRNGYPGVAQWGGWVWSGDTESSWKTLETQIAVGLNYAVSIGPYWGTDIGGFFPNKELTGELYARWFQFGAFNALFRSHGVTWHTRLPWGWGAGTLGPPEGKNHPLLTELNNPAIEPIVKKYDELRYQLLPYTYTLAWQAREKGLPLMRPMWLHYPDDERCKTIHDQYLWGRDLLIAPVYKKGATSRTVYLPKGDWYDWWENKKMEGNKRIKRLVDLSILPIYVRAGAIIPVDPVRQYTAEKVAGPTTLKIFTGADGSFILYEDDGSSQDYLKGKSPQIKIVWNDKEKILTLAPDKTKTPRTFKVQLIPGKQIKLVHYTGQTKKIQF